MKVRGKTESNAKQRGVDWRAPIGLGVLSASGLLSALVSDGIGDVWAWFGLTAPLIAAGYCIWRRTKPKSSLRGKRVSKRQRA